MKAPLVLTIGQLNAYVKSLLDGDDNLNHVYVSAEISNFTNHYRTGHFYFSLKDENAVIRAVMFRSSAQRLKFLPQDGMRVIVRGRVSLYERDGQYQLYVDDLQPDGVGALNLAYEQLKEKLSKEGLFAPERKKTLPRYPMRVGVVTSPTGAAVRDIINVLSRRFPLAQIILQPVQVQGADAPGQIADAIRLFNEKKAADVLIVGRGGGSLEELWAFNEEEVARAVAASEIPVVSAVGHETDFTLADFAADRRAATPSQAAELVVADADAYLRYVEELTARGERVLLHQLEQAQHKLQRLQDSWALTRPERWLEPLQQRTDMAMRQLQGRMESILRQRQHEFGLLAARLDALSPLTVLARGYSITKTDAGKALRSIEDVRWGEELRTQVADGDVISIVQQVERREQE